MAVGLPAKTTYADGDVFSASDINDTNGTLNLVGQTTNFYAGKNRIINGDFRINQRLFTSNTTTGTFNFDRWAQGNTGGTFTVTPQTFTLGAAPVAGYEGSTFLQGVTASQSSSGDLAVFTQRIESVRTFANQTVTVSFWAKATSGTPKIGTTFQQLFGTGGSPSAIVTVNGQSSTISTSWARYSWTFSVPSISGKTIGTNNDDSLQFEIWCSGGSTYDTRSGSVGIQNNTFNIWGVQVESGSTATAFQTATGTIQAELSLAQRYYYRRSVSSYGFLAQGIGYSTTTIQSFMQFPVPMRVAPPAIETSAMSTFLWESGTSSQNTPTSITISSFATTNEVAVFDLNKGSIGTNSTPYRIQGNNALAHLGFSAEL
jgi:hypothetical protein